MKIFYKIVIKSHKSSKHPDRNKRLILDIKGASININKI